MDKQAGTAISLIPYTALYLSALPPSSIQSPIPPSLRLHNPLPLPHLLAATLTAICVWSTPGQTLRFLLSGSSIKYYISWYKGWLIIIYIYIYLVYRWPIMPHTSFRVGSLNGIVQWVCVHMVYIILYYL